MSIRISACYPASDGGRFDFDYYAQQHVPMVYELLGTYGCRGIQIDRGVAGGPGQPAPFAAIGHMEFDSVDDFRAGFKEHGRAILADVANYTDITPVTQVSEIVSAFP